MHASGVACSAMLLRASSIFMQLHRECAYCRGPNQVVLIPKLFEEKKIISRIAYRKTQIRGGAKTKRISLA